MSQMNCFLVAAECLNFTKAAERLLPVAARTEQADRAMEREMGLELFVRGRNSVRLTEAGEICANYITKMRGDYQQMLEEAAKAQDDQHSSFVIGVSKGS